MRWNPYLYAGANPANYVDPSGELFWLVAGLFLLGVGIDYGMQRAMGLDNIDELSMLTSGLMTVVGGKIAGKAASLGWSFARRIGLEIGADIVISTAIDTTFRDGGFSAAFQRNLVASIVGSVVGEGVGAGLGRAGRALRGVDVNAPRVHGGVDTPNGRVRISRRTGGTDYGASLRNRRAWYADDLEDGYVPDIVYRNPSIRTNEHPRALTEGFIPKYPDATYKVAYHISHGNVADTQFVSTTRSLETALAHQQPGVPIYVVDLNKVPGRIYDFIDPDVTAEYLLSGRTRNLAVRAYEVTIEGAIPPDAVRGVLDWEWGLPKIFGD